MGTKKSFVSISLVSAIVCAVIFILTFPSGAFARSVELSVALHVPPKAAPYPDAFKPYTEEITKRTDGRVKFKFYLSQTLSKARDNYTSVKNGIADMSWFSISLTPGAFPLSSVVTLPYMSPDTYVGSRVFNELYRIFPEIRNEHKDVHVLFLWVSLPYEIHTNVPVRSIADVKGMKLATQPGARAALEALGVVPVTMPTPQMYQTIEKGIADGAALAWGAYKAFKIYEVTKYHINPHLAAVHYSIIMNKSTWNRLSKKDQAIITDLTAEMMPEKLCGAVTGEMNQGIEISKGKGHPILDLSPEEFAKWQATGKPAWEEWVKTMEAKGLPGRKVLDKTIKLVEKYAR